MKGSSARSGPAPDPNALRRDRPSDQAGWTVLDGAGRKGKVPEWPLSTPTVREVEVWRRQWSRPQAVEWERNGQGEEVALYVRTLVAAEDLEASTAVRTLAKQLQEALGLSLPGLLRLRWRIGEVDKPAKSVGGRGAARSSRDRFTVIEGGQTS